MPDSIPGARNKAVYPTERPDSLLPSVAKDRINNQMAGATWTMDRVQELRQARAERSAFYSGLE